MDRSARLWIRLRSHATRAISKNLRLPFWPLRVFRMRQTRRNSSREMKKHRRRMFVRLNGIAKRNVSQMLQGDRKSTRLNSSHGYISYAVFCLKKKKQQPDDNFYLRPRWSEHII